MAAKSGFKQDIFAQIARIGKALGNANRLELLEFLAQGPRSVEQLATVSGLSVANTSQHLQALRRLGLVSARKEGLRVYYALSGDDVVALLDTVRRVAEDRIAEVQKLVGTYLTTRDALEPIAAKELLGRARKGLVTVLDVRPAEEYEAGHLPGAINIPLAKLEGRLNRLPKNKEIVAYCRGPYCVLAFEAVARLRKKGLQARRLEDGYPEWRMRGLPVETGPEPR
ncbi:MAG: ArsR/SmtB family transcription factor [Burkholderiales bacterium]